MGEPTKLERLRAALELDVLTGRITRIAGDLQERGWDPGRAQEAATRIVNGREAA